MVGCNKSGKKENTLSTQVKTQSVDSIKTENITFESEGIKLAGTIYSPKQPHSAVVIVHGSDRVPRMTEFAKLFAKNDILYLMEDGNRESLIQLTLIIT